MNCSLIRFPLLYTCRGIVVSFVLSGILLITSAPLYFFGTLFQKVCNDMAPPRYVFLTNTVDNQSVWEGSTLLGFLLASRLNISAANISVSATLE